LREAAEQGDLAKVKKLIASDQELLWNDMQQEEPALHCAIRKEQYDVIRFLVEKSSFLDSLDQAALTPLMAASKQGLPMLPVVKQLLAGGADPDITPESGPNRGMTSLYFAAQSGCLPMVEALIEAGARTKIRTWNGMTAMHAAAEGGNAEVIRRLRNRRVDPNTLSKYGPRPIHVAARAGYKDAVAALIDMGVPVDAKDKDGATPLAIAAVHNEMRVARFLLDKGADPNVRFKLDDAKTTPLRVALLKRHEGMLKLLAESGANPESKVGGVSVRFLTEQAEHRWAGMTLSLAACRRRKQAKERNKSVGKSGKKAEKATPAANPERSVESAPDSSPQEKVSAKSGPSELTKPSVVMIGAYYSDLRYDDDEHGEDLPADFAKARREWVKSGNDPSSPHYAQACKLISKHLESEYKVRFGVRFGMGMDEDNLPAEVRALGFSDPEALDKQLFSKRPKLAYLQALFIDFRKEPSTSPYKKGQELLRSPELGIVALYEAKLSKRVKNTTELKRLLAANEELFSGCFSIGLKDELFETVEEDEDGDTFTSSSCSMSCGDLVVEVNEGQTPDEFLGGILQKIHDEHRPESLLDDSFPELKRLVAQADHRAIKQKLDQGMDPNVMVGDESLLRVVLMAHAIAARLFKREEMKDRLTQKFGSLEGYRSELKKIVLELISKGADVQSDSGEPPLMALANMGGDDEIRSIVREAAEQDSPDDMSFLLAVERGEVENVRAALDNGARVNKRVLPGFDTPLMFAAQGPGGEKGPPLQGEQLAAQEEVVRLLLSHGAEVNASSWRGDTAIGNAVRRGNASIVRLLLDAGASVDEALPKGESLLAMAKARGHKEIMALLSGAANKEHV
jgi:ankyrin repeat protein